MFRVQDTLLQLKWINLCVQNKGYSNTIKVEQFCIFRVQDTAAQSDQYCEPITKLAFAKTHKTGSSTLQNILFRYLVKLVS